MRNSRTCSSDPADKLKMSTNQTIDLIRNSNIDLGYMNGLIEPEKASTLMICDCIMYPRGKSSCMYSCLQVCMESVLEYVEVAHHCRLARSEYDPTVCLTFIPNGGIK